MSMPGIRYRTQHSSNYRCRFVLNHDSAGNLSYNTAASCAILIRRDPIIRHRRRTKTRLRRPLRFLDAELLPLLCAEQTVSSNKPNFFDFFWSTGIKQKADGMNECRRVYLGGSLLSPYCSPQRIQAEDRLIYVAFFLKICYITTSMGCWRLSGSAGFAFGLFELIE